MVDAARPAVEGAVKHGRAAGPAVAAVAHALGLAWRFRTVALVGLGVGLLTAAASYLAPPALSATISGIGGACTALAVQGGCGSGPPPASWAWRDRPPDRHRRLRKRRRPVRPPPLRAGAGQPVRRHASWPPAEQSHPTRCRGHGVTLGPPVWRAEDPLF